VKQNFLDNSNPGFTWPVAGDVGEESGFEGHFGRIEVACLQGLYLLPQRTLRAQRFAKFLLFFVPLRAPL
jgi:hypothetical protein